ncbi:hypothetical protein CAUPRSCDRAFT_13260, partial [Caulochytrium protostelioides]
MAFRPVPGVKSEHGMDPARQRQSHHMNVTPAAIKNWVYPSTFVDSDRSYEADSVATPGSTTAMHDGTSSLEPRPLEPHAQASAHPLTMDDTPLRPRRSKRRACEACHAKRRWCDAVRPTCHSCASAAAAAGIPPPYEPCVYTGDPPSPRSEERARAISALQRRLRTLETLYRDYQMSHVARRLPTARPHGSKSASGAAAHPSAPPPPGHYRTLSRSTSASQQSTAASAAAVSDTEDPDRDLESESYLPGPAGLYLDPLHPSRLEPRAMPSPSASKNAAGSTPSKGSPTRFPVEADTGLPYFPDARRGTVQHPRAPRPRHVIDRADPTVLSKVEWFLIHVAMSPPLAVLHPATFRANLSRVSTFLLATVLLLSAWHRTPDDPVRAQHTHWYRVARETLDIDVPSLETVQGMVLLRSYIIGRGLWRRSAMISFAMARMIVYLGIDCDPDDQVAEPIDGPMLRRMTDGDRLKREAGHLPADDIKPGGPRDPATRSGSESAATPPPLSWIERELRRRSFWSPILHNLCVTSVTGQSPIYDFNPPDATESPSQAMATDAYPPGSDAAERLFLRNVPERAIIHDFTTGEPIQSLLPRTTVKLPCSSVLWHLAAPSDAVDPPLLLVLALANGRPRALAFANLYVHGPLHARWMECLRREARGEPFDMSLAAWTR